MKDKICLALDVDTVEEATQLAKRLSKWVGIFKIGSHLFATGEGKRIIDTIHESGSEVFLDLKWHDIPNTVANAAKVATSMGIYMMNVHALGGSNMMKMVTEYVSEEAAKTGKRKPILLAITVLTSMSDEDLKKDLLVNVPVTDYVEHLALVTKKSGFNGVVCSPKEIKTIKRKCGDDFLTVTPGIRPKWMVKKDDQKRVTTPREAIENGANYIVVGRPILKAENPEKAAAMLLSEIS